MGAGRTLGGFTSRPQGTLRVTVTGGDRPGVTSALFGALGGADIEVLDVEQVVVRGRLVLGLLVTAGDDEAALRAQLAEVAEYLGMEVEAVSGTDEDTPRSGGRLHVTVLGHPLRPAAGAALPAPLPRPPPPPHPNPPPPPPPP